jgi:hypothetical protein
MAIAIDASMHATRITMVAAQIGGSSRMAGMVERSRTKWRCIQSRSRTASGGCRAISATG